jgi:type IV pilus assembly protein PilX
MNTPFYAGRAKAGERGVVLFVALIVLVVMTLAGLALMRQMTAGSSIAGNVAFKESATSVGDLGVEKGYAWLLDPANGPQLNTSQPTAGYSAIWAPNVDPATFGNNWDPAFTASASEAVAATGNDVRYVIHRLCAVEGLGPSAAGQICSDSDLSTINGGSQTGCSYSTCLPSPVPGPLYRITARVIGPRNAVSFVQVLVN